MGPVEAVLLGFVGFVGAVSVPTVFCVARTVFRGGSVQNAKCARRYD